MTKSLATLAKVPSISNPLDLSLANCIEGNHLSKYDPQVAGEAIVNELYKTTVLLQSDITKPELAIWAQDILNRYPTETYEDIVYTLNKGITRKIYGSFNINVFYEWLTNHLEDKADQREREHEQRKGADPYKRTSEPRLISKVTKDAVKFDKSSGWGEKYFEK